MDTTLFYVGNNTMLLYGSHINTLCRPTNQAITYTITIPSMSASATSKYYHELPNAMPTSPDHHANHIMSL
jgi:hypothetical protein